MIHRQAVLSAEEVQSLAKIESSSQHWSAQFTQLSIQAKYALSQVESLNQARSQLLNAAYRTVGVDENTVQNIQVRMNKDTKEGILDIICFPPSSPEDNIAANGMTSENSEKV